MGGGEEITPEKVRLPHLKLTTEQPLKAYGLTCAAHCSMCILFIALILGLGSTFFPFFSDVPLYLLDNFARERFDALAQGQKFATFTPGEEEVELARTTGEDANAIEFTVEIIYIPTDSTNILTQDRLDRIREFELSVLNKEEYQDWCELDWLRADRSSDTFTVPAAQAFGNFTTGSTTTIAAFCNNAAATDATRSYCNTEFAEQRRVPCVPPLSASNPCYRSTHSLVTSQYSTDCNDVDSFPAGLFNCPTAGQTCSMADGVAFSSEELLAKLNQYGNYNSYFGSDPVKFTQASAFAFQVTDATFGGGTVTARSLRSQFYFGVPIAGYNRVSDDLDAQADDIGEFVYDTYASLLFDANIDGVEVWFNGYQMEVSFIEEQLVSDGSWAVASFVFVLLFMRYMTGSWWLSLMGMGQILMSFSSAYFLYFMFGQRYFGVFNLLSVFIILGIGADDIFVFLDTLRQSSIEEFGVPQDRMSRFSWTWRRAAKAMAVTSSTTIASFLSNAVSSFPAISTFGIFAAMLVLVNYCSVILYYPTVAAVYEEYMNREGSCWMKIDCLCGLGKYPLRLFQVIEARAHNLSVDEYQKQKEENKISIEEFFADKYTPFLQRTKYGFFLLFGFIFVVSIVSAATLEVEKEAPQFLPSSHNFGGFGNKKADLYSRGGSIYALTMQTVLGFDSNNPIDRSGTSASNTTDLGEPNYDENFDFVRGMPCLLQFCDTMAIKNDPIAIGGEPEFEVECWAREYRRWIIETYGEDDFYNFIGTENCPNDGTDTWYANGPCWGKFSVRIAEFFTIDGGQNFARWGGYLFGDNCGGSVQCPGVNNTGVPRFTYAEMKLTSDFTIDFEDGIALNERIDTWWKEQAVIGNCSGPNGLEGASPGFFTGNFFHFFYVQEVLIDEAFTGILISVCLAWGVLVLATGNVVVGSLAALMIAFIVIGVMGFCVIMGWKLGVTETINFVMVPGMSVDYVAHLAEAYSECEHKDRYSRVRVMLEEVGVSVVSGAVTSLGAAFFLFFPLIVFFVKFGAFIFATILLSLLWALVFFPCLMLVVGPQGDFGNWHAWVHKMYQQKNGVPAGSVGEQAKKASGSSVDQGAQPTQSPPLEEVAQQGQSMTKEDFDVQDAQL